MLFGTAKVTSENELFIGGVSTRALVNAYGTPLFVYDVANIRKTMQEYKQSFETLGVNYRVIYASKAFCSLAMYRLLQEENFSCDVVSGGELYTALKAGMNPAAIEFHGNNKSFDELMFAVEENVGTIVVDNFQEIDWLQEILEKKRRKQVVLFRVSPGVEAQTHAYISTGQVDSKFGFDVKSGQAEEALQRLLRADCFKVKGIHCHVGSQIFGVEGFRAAIQILVELLDLWREKFQFIAEVLNVGGGFGVSYTEEDRPLSIQKFLHEIVQEVRRCTQEVGYPEPEIRVEPGRSLVAESGTTLYEVGSMKEISGVRKYVAVNGGMGDNLRPALYGATYEVRLVNRLERLTEKVTICGKYCESGDILVKDVVLPKLQAGDILAVSTTGAYGYSMASVYNRNPRPAVVFVENGEAQLVIRRETYEDLLALEVENEKKVGDSGV